VWRTCQDAAVLGASALGWPPERFRSVGSAFVVRQMTVVHDREARYGEPIAAKTWISRFRRGLLCDRQILVTASGSPLARATQEWAHVTTVDGVMRAARADDALVRDFPAEAPDDAVVFPPFEQTPEGPEHVLRFRCWHTWMDPLAHANHPAYIDWADEALARVLVAAGGDPVAVQPIAEWARWRVGVVAPAEVTVRTRLIGLCQGDVVVCEHQIDADGRRSVATVRTQRRLAEGRSQDLIDALKRAPGGGR